jgi:hypothetical protein
MSFRRRTSESIAELQRELASLKAQGTPSETAEASEAEDASTLPPPSLGTSLTDVHDLVRQLSDRVDGLDSRQLRDHERLSLRLEELTTQFTNQLREIGGELDAAHQQLGSQLAAQDQRLDELSAAANEAVASANGKPTPEAALVEELRTNQVRIANDLARHEIAVRQDLAALAELVNRSRSAR